MTWWGWSLLAFYIVMVLWVARKRAQDIISDFRNPDGEDYAMATFLGFTNGIFFPLFIIGVLLVWVLFPNQAKQLLNPFIPERNEEEEEQTDEEVRKQIEQLRREYAMPKWKRFVLRVIRV